jgi:catechol 2,3-dioxygenase-like lactoylglutathione lyase family enzyme
MGIREVIIAVGDLDEAVDFYTRVVGCKQVRTVDTGERSVIELDADGQRITLLRDDHPAVHLVFDTEDANRVHRRLRRRDVPTRAPQPVTVEGGAFVGFADPWGNRLAFWQDRSDEPDEADED